MGASRVNYANQEPKKIVDAQRALNVLVMPEHALKDPSEEFDLSQAHAEAKNLGRREAVLSRILRSLVRRLTGFALACADEALVMGKAKPLCPSITNKNTRMAVP